MMGGWCPNVTQILELHRELPENNLVTSVMVDGPVFMVVLVFVCLQHI